MIITSKQLPPGGFATYKRIADGKPVRMFPWDGEAVVIHDDGTQQHLAAHEGDRRGFEGFIALTDAGSPYAISSYSHDVDYVLVV